MKLDFTEIEKLKEMLDKDNIPYEYRDLYEGKQIIYYNNGKRICDAVIHKYSYGGDIGLLEMMGLCDSEDNVDGNLTAEEVYDRISYYDKRHKKESD